MAIWYTDQGRSFGARVGQGAHRNVVAATAIVAMTTTMIDNADDEVTLFWLPKGAVIVGIAATASDMDSGTTLAFDIGDDADEDRLMSNSAIGQAATASTALAPTGVLYKYTADTRIKAYTRTAATGASAGTLTVVVYYFVDPEFSTTGLAATTTA